MPGQKTLQQGEGLSEKTQSRRMRGGKKAQEDAPFSEEEGVCLCATGSNSIAQVLPKYQREGDMSLSPQESCSVVEA